MLNDSSSVCVCVCVSPVPFILSLTKATKDHHEKATWVTSKATKRVTAINPGQTAGWEMRSKCYYENRLTVNSVLELTYLSIQKGFFSLSICIRCNEHLSFKGPGGGTKWKKHSCVWTTKVGGFEGDAVTHMLLLTSFCLNHNWEGFVSRRLVGAKVAAVAHRIRSGQFTSSSTSVEISFNVNCVISVHSQVSYCRLVWTFFQTD